MSSSASPIRRIASNLLWTPEGLVRRPLVLLAGDGSLLSVGSCPEPDRMAATEFYSGLLVPGFPPDFRPAFARLLATPAPLCEALSAMVVPHGVWVVLSGLDYTTLRFTSRSAIRRL